MGKLQENLFWISDQSASVLLNWFSRESFSLQLIKLSFVNFQNWCILRIGGLLQRIVFCDKGKNSWELNPGPLFPQATAVSFSYKIFQSCIHQYQNYCFCFSILDETSNDSGSGENRFDGWSGRGLISILTCVKNMHVSHSHDSVHTTVIFIVRRNAHVY